MIPPTRFSYATGDKFMKSLTLREIGEKLEVAHTLLNNNSNQSTRINLEILLDILIGCLEEPEFLRISVDPAEIVSLASAFRTIKTTLPQFNQNNKIELHKSLCIAIKEFYSLLIN